jgi:nitrate/nitrite-specific signal transduction histidine kinase
MQERAREIGAQVSINSRAGQGTTLSVMVPLRRASLNDSEVDARNKVEHLIG